MDYVISLKNFKNFGLAYAKIWLALKVSFLKVLIFLYYPHSAL